MLWTGIPADTILKGMGKKALRWSWNMVISMPFPVSSASWPMRSFISLYVLKVSPTKATIIMEPPMMAAQLSGSPVRNQSTRATMKMVSRAATDDSTGEVREIRTRKEPLNVALASTAQRTNRPVVPVGNSR